MLLFVQLKYLFGKSYYSNNNNIKKEETQYNASLYQININILSNYSLIKSIVIENFNQSPFFRLEFIVLTFSSARIFHLRHLHIQSPKFVVIKLINIGNVPSDKSGKVNP